MNGNDFVPLVLFPTMFGMIYGVVYLYRRERMAMIERGMDPRNYKPRSFNYNTLKWGLLLIGSGLGLFFCPSFLPRFAGSGAVIINPAGAKSGFRSFRWFSSHVRIHWTHHHATNQLVRSWKRRRKRRGKLPFVGVGDPSQQPQFAGNDPRPWWVQRVNDRINTSIPAQRTCSRTALCQYPYADKRHTGNTCNAVMRLWVHILLALSSTFARHGS